MLKTILAAAAVLALTCAAPAVDFSTQIVSLDGSPLTDATGKPSELTLGTVAKQALLAPYPDEQNLLPAEKWKRFMLAQKIEGKAEVELSAEEVVMLKALIAKLYNPLVMGQAWTILDPGIARAPR